MISLTCIMISSTVLNITHNDIPHNTEQPTVLIISSTCIMISPTVLNITHGTQDIPTALMDTHDFPSPVVDSVRTCFVFAAVFNPISTGLFNLVVALGGGGWGVSIPLRKI